MRSGRYDFDAVLRPNHHDPGTDDLPSVIREHFQLLLNQQFYVLEDIGKITGRSHRIKSQVSFPVLLKLRCRTLGDPKAMFQAVQAAFKRFCLSPIVSPTPRKPAAISEIISEILRLVEVLDFFDRFMFGPQQTRQAVPPVCLLRRAFPVGFIALTLCGLNCSQRIAAEAPSTLPR